MVSLAVSVSTSMMDERMYHCPPSHHPAFPPSSISILDPRWCARVHPLLIINNKPGIGHRSLPATASRLANREIHQLPFGRTPHSSCSPSSASPSSERGSDGRLARTHTSYSQPVYAAALCFYSNTRARHCQQQCDIFSQRTDSDPAHEHGRALDLGRSRRLPLSPLS